MLKIASQRKNILLVDDDRSVSQMLTMLLETRGYNVDVAFSGAEALEKATSHPDLILLDLILPDQGGLQICQKIKAIKDMQNVPVIILSAKVLSEDIIEGLYLGADDYLTKPFDYEELVARMEAVMRRGSIFQNGGDDSTEKFVIQELNTIILEEKIQPYFQPIYVLEPFKLLGLEVLTRPQTEGLLSNPELLFKAALKYGRYNELELLSWKKALAYAQDHIEDKKLFLNCSPYLVEGPKFMSVKTLFDNSTIKIEDTVLEITERSAVRDYKGFYEHLHKYRDYGFQFAVDDVGGGYASLESIVETKPEVVKIDQHIIKGLHKDSFKQSIVKFIVSFCKENGILSIAEGLETREDLTTVMKLGIDAGQGFLLCKPTPEINIQVMQDQALSVM